MNKIYSEPTEIIETEWRTVKRALSELALTVGLAVVIASLILIALNAGGF